MRITLHAFTSYYIKTELGYSEIIYENDNDFDISYSNCHYIHTILRYGSFLLNKNILLPVYDCIDDADIIKEKGMRLIAPEDIVNLCLTVIENLKYISNSINPLIDNSEWYLYDSDIEESFSMQKNKLLYYAEKLLYWSEQGLYLVWDNE